jgi:hypothetical protein
MPTASTMGAVLGMDTEASFGSGGTPTVGTALRYENLTAPSDLYDLVDNSNVGHAHSYDKADDPQGVTVNKPGSLTFDYRTRVSTSADTIAPLMTMLESAGFLIETSAATTVAGTPAVDSIELTADNGGVGRGLAVQLQSAHDGFPTIAAAYAASTITPGMDLPSAPAASNTAHYTMTATPYTRQTPTGKSLTFVRHTRESHDGTDENMVYTHSACGLDGVGEITLAHGQPIVWPMAFGVGKTARSDSGINTGIAAETFLDGEEFCVVDDNFEYGIATAASAGGITRAVANFIEAKLNLGFTAPFIPGTGGGTTGGAQGIIHVPGRPTATVTALYNRDHWTELELTGAGQITHKYMHFIQPGIASGQNVTIGFFFPNMYLDPETPPIVDYSENTVKSTATYVASSAEYGSDDQEGEPGMAPYHIVLAGL